jgi:hypothetical protein
LKTIHKLFMAEIAKAQAEDDTRGVEVHKNERAHHFKHCRWP